MKAVIDRFEEDKAVLILEPTGDRIIWPAAGVPEGAREGDMLDINMTIDKEQTEKRSKESRDIIDRLTGNK